MRTLATLSLLLSTTVAAHAVDFPPVPAYPAPPPIFQPVIPLKPVWAGFYLGANLGGGWANAQADYSTTGPVFASTDNFLSGVAGGLTVGYNWQMDWFVVGVETDFQFADVSDTVSTRCPAGTCAVALAANYDHKIPWFGTVRARMGYAQDTWLVYLTGGYAYSKLEVSGTATAGATTVNFSQDNTRDGWTIGTGIEVALTPTWSIKTEYLYADLGSVSSSVSVPGLPTLADTTKLNLSAVRMGVNYRF